MKKILFLSFLCCIKLSFALPIPSKLDTTKTLNNNNYKYIVACAAALSANFFLDYISTYAHGMAYSDGDCTITMSPHANLLGPWVGNINYRTIGKKELSVFTISTGLLAGIGTTYLQGVALKTINEHTSHKKPLKESLSEGLKFPITIFSDAIKVGKGDCSHITNQQADDLTEQPTITSLTLNGLLILRTSRIISETLSGLLLYEKSKTHKTWNQILNNPSTLPISLAPAITMATLSAPYLIGATQAMYEKYTKI